MIGCLLFACSVSGQQSTWLKSFGGSLVDRGVCVTSTRDGGIVVSGGFESNDGDFDGLNSGNSDHFIRKLDFMGRLQWVSARGAYASEWTFSHANTDDGGFIVTGGTTSNDGLFCSRFHAKEDIYVLKYDFKGILQWSKCIGGWNYDGGASVQSSSLGGYIVSGFTLSQDGDFARTPKGDHDIFVMKLDRNGDLIWQKTFGGGGLEEGYSVSETIGGDIFVTGGTNSNDDDFAGFNRGERDVFVLKLNSKGVILWKRTFGGLLNEEGYSVAFSVDGGCVISGPSSSKEGFFGDSNKGWEDIFIVRLDAEGNVMWKKLLGGSGGDLAYGIKATSDGGFVVAGSTRSNDGDFFALNKGADDIFVIKVNAEGTLLWKRTFGGSNKDVGLGLTTTQDGGLAIAGYTLSNDGDFDGRPKNGYSDAFVLKLDSDGEISTSSIDTNIVSFVNVFPNPVATMLPTISYSLEHDSKVLLEISNLFGQVVDTVFERNIMAGSYQELYSIAELASGLYLVRLITDTGSASAFMSVIR